MKQFFLTGTYETQLRVGLYIKHKYNLFYVNICMTHFISLNSIKAITNKRSKFLLSSRKYNFF